MTDQILDPEPRFVIVDGVVYAWGFRADGTYGLVEFPGGGSEPPPSNGNGEQGEIVYINPPDIQWVVGVLDPNQGFRNPNVGDGKLVAWYYKKEFTNATLINLSIWIHLHNGDPGVSSGGYEIILPPELSPSVDWYSRSTNIWMSGIGQKEYTGSAKWHLTDKTTNPMRIIFTFDGVEWTPSEPRPYNGGEGCKLRMTGLEYLL